MDTAAILNIALIILALAAPILLTLLSRGGLKALGALKAKTEAETESGLAREGILRLLHIAEVVVLDIEATIKPAVVEALEDRKLTKEEGEKLKKLAVDRLKTILTEQGKAELMDMIGIAGSAVDVYLGGVVEKAVVTVKTESARADAIQTVAEVNPAAVVP